MKKTKNIVMIALLTALYFVLSFVLKIPTVGNIRLDLGYIALTVGAVLLGAKSAMIIGGLGAFLESALTAANGISLGWILMNMIIGFACGLVLKKKADGERKRFVLTACIVIPVSVFVGVVVKTLIDCMIYKYSIIVKIPSSTAAWIADSLVMLLFGLPLSMALKRRNIMK